MTDRPQVVTTTYDLGGDPAVEQTFSGEEYDVLSAPADHVEIDHDGELETLADTKITAVRPPADIGEDGDWVAVPVDVTVFDAGGNVESEHTISDYKRVTQTALGVVDVIRDGEVSTFLNAQVSGIDRPADYGETAT